MPLTKSFLRAELKFPYTTLTSRTGVIVAAGVAELATASEPFRP